MINLYDRIKEITYTIGLNNLSLGGAVNGFSTFSSVYSNSGELFYAVTDGTNYEVGSGLYLSSTNSIKRFPTRSTNSNQLVNFQEGLKEVFVNYPATNSVFNTIGINATPQNSGLAFWTSPNSLSYSNKLVFDSGYGRIGINQSSPTFSLDIGGNSPSSIVKASGFITGNSGIYFPSGNGDLSSYSGGRQIFHFEPNQIISPLSSVLEVSGIVNQNILLKKQSTNLIFAGPSGGCIPPCNPDYPTFRRLVIDDIPDLSSLYYTVSNGITISGMLISSSGALNSKIIAASGALNSRITSVSGYLDNKINSFNPSVTVNNSTNNGRLSLSSTDSTFDGSGTALYFTPHNGNLISLYNNTSWSTRTFSSTLVCNFSSLSPNTIYDVFIFLNGNNINFELIPWTMPNLAWEEGGLPNAPELSRNVQLDTFDAIKCKAGSNAKRYIGTIRTGSTSFLDTPTKRFIYNHNNKVNKSIKSIPALSNITYIYTDSQRWDMIDQIPIVDIINGNDSTQSTLDVEGIIFAQFNGYNSGYNFLLYSQGVTVDDSDLFINEYIYDLQNSSDIISYIEGNNNNTIYYGNFVTMDYQDFIGITLRSRLAKNTISAHTKIVCIQKPFNTNPVSIILDKSKSSYGIFGTYQC